MRAIIWLAIAGYVGHKLCGWLFKTEISDSSPALSSDHSSPVVTAALSDVDLKIRSLIEDGYVSKAVKLYADNYGVDAHAAMDAIDEIEKQLRASKTEQRDESSKAEPAPQTLTEKTQAQTSSDVVGDIRVLLAAGKKIEAIKRHRERFGTGLKEAKEAVEEIASSPHWTHHTTETSHFEFETSEAVSWTTPVSETTIAEDADIIALVKADRIIDAIKLLRERTGLSLRAAKDAVDSIRETHG